MADFTVFSFVLGAMRAAAGFLCLQKGLQGWGLLLSTTIAVSALSHAFFWLTIALAVTRVYYHSFK